MKKIMLFASALAGMFFAASCQQENLEPVHMGNAVTITVEAPGVMNTKAIADGLNVNEVHYAVYKTNEGVDYSIYNEGEGATNGPLAQGVVPMSNKNATINFDLLQDQEYTVLFWAQVEGAGHYNLGDLRTIKVATSVMGNDETRAAFYARYDFSTYEHKDHVVTLKRPFAQLNLLTTAESLTPVQTGQTQGYTIDVKKSEVVVAGLADTFNTLTGLAPEGEAKFVFQMAATPEEQGQETLVVNGKAYHYVSMNYFFVPQDEKLVDIKYTVSTDKGDIKNEIVSVPVKENYRTNVIGNLLTKESTFEIVVDANFDGQELVPVWDQREVSEPAKVDGKYVISTASELAWLSAASNGTLPVTENGQLVSEPAKNFKNETFVLLEDIDLENIAWTPIGTTVKFLGDFDGNGKTIKNLNVAVNGDVNAGLFGNSGGYIKNLTVVGAQVTGQAKAGVILGNGVCGKIENCHVKDATVTTTPFDNDNGNHAGAIAGYISAEDNGWVINCSVDNATISAYRDVAALVGTATRSTGNSARITGNKVSNVTVIADQTAEYGEAKAANAGEIVGRNIGATLTDNAAENVTVYVLVKKASQLQNALNTVTAGTVEIRFAADINGDVTVDQQEGKNIVINGDGKKFDGTIYVDGNSNNTGAETLLIKKVNFETAAASLNFVEQNSTDSAVRYAHNVTIQECTFKGGAEVVGVKFRQCFNITIKDSKVLSGHSLAQLYGCTGVTIDGVTIKAGRGVSFGTSTNCSVNNATVVAGSYGFRADAGADLTVQNSVVTAAYPIAVRNLTEGTTYDLNVKATKLTSTKGYQVIFTAADSEDKFVQPAGAYTFTTDAEYFVFPGETVIAYETEGLKAAIKAAQNGDVIYLANGGSFEGLFYVEGKGLTIESLGQSTINGKLAIAAAGKTVNVKGVTFENSYDGSVTAGHQYLDKTGKYCIGLYCASVNVEDCTFNLSDNGAINFYAVNAPERCTVKNSTFNCNGFRPILSKADVTVDGCTFNDQYKYALQVWGNANTGNESVVFTNNTIKNAGMSSACADVYKSYVSVSGSYELANVAFTISGNTPGYNFVYDNKATVNMLSCSLNGAQIVAGQCFPAASDINEVLATPAYAEVEGGYEIYSAKGMFWFADQVNVAKNAFNGKTVKLAANIDLANAAWTPVGQTGATQFKGTFDGQGKTISNLNIDATAQTGGHYSSGIFGWLNAATVKNVNVAGAKVKGNHNVGVIAGYLETAGCTIEACHVSDATVECHVANDDANGDKCGVIVGNAPNAGTPIKACTATDSTVSAGRDAGQIVGAAKEAYVTDCSATNVTVTANGEGTGKNIRNEVIGRLL